VPFCSVDIIPCPTIPDREDTVFHLLTCGHLVIVPCLDSRCGLNCLHVVDEGTHSRLEDSSEGVESKEKVASREISDDWLYCPTCEGLPIETWKLTHANEHSVRRSRITSPATQAVLRALPGVGSDSQANVLLSPLYFVVSDAEIDGRSVPHELQCGHRVLCESTRACAPNCCKKAECGLVEHGIGTGLPKTKQAGAIICSECVLRAEHMIKRYQEAKGTTKAEYNQQQKQHE
jgi:hypothetical protein